MRSPFVYGRIATGSQFIDREQETELLATSFCNLTNTIIISPRRWGKSSLVRKAAEAAVKRDRKLNVCHLDIFNVRTEAEFYQKLAETVLKTTASKWEEVLTSAQRYLSRLVPSISIGDVQNNLTLSFGIQPSMNTADELLDLAEKIAEEKRISIVVCIDEFQQIANFEDADAFQRKLRSHWQLHTNVAYCLYGSRRHMMTDIFTNPEKPFYKFGQMLFLEKIDAGLWPAFITSRFSDTGRSICEEQCRRIVELTDNNPYYIQQLCEMVWNRTKDVCTSEIIEDAFQQLVDMQAGLNLALTQTLTLSQQSLLHAIVNGETQLTSASVLSRYELKNSLTVQRARKALAKLDIIDDFGKKVTMEDPVYAWWLRNVYFR